MKFKYCSLIVIFIFNVSAFSQIKSDTSNFYWSVVSPVCVGFDIDFGFAIIDKAKDTLINEYLINIGKANATIDSIYIAGEDYYNFEILAGSHPYTLQIKDTHHIELRFKPNKKGPHSAELKIHFNGKILTYQLKGEGVNSDLLVKWGQVDCGYVYVRDSVLIKEVFIISNVGVEPIFINNVKKGGSNKTDFKILPSFDTLTLFPKETHKIDIRFKPSKKGRTSGELEFFHDKFGSPGILQLFGTGLELNPKINTNSPICIGDNLELFVELPGNLDYYEHFWYGPDGFTSNIANPVIKNVSKSNNGTYYYYTKIKSIYSDTISKEIIVSNYQVNAGDSSIIFVGNARKVKNYIKLTDAKTWDGGSIWLKNRFSVYNDFQTTFKFSIHYGDNNNEKEYSIPGADGIALVFQNQNYPMLGVVGGSIGYVGIVNSLAIEFDLFENKYDPNGNHVAVQSMGSKANSADHSIESACLGINSDMILIQQDSIYHVKIEHSNTMHNLKIWIDKNGEWQNPVLTIDNFDLGDYLNLEDDEFVYIGFTAATGNCFQEHRIYDWTIPCDNQILNVQNYIEVTDKLKVNPNPFSNITEVVYTLADDCEIELTLYNISGMKVQNLASGKQTKGTHKLTINSENLNSGTYNLILKSCGKSVVEKVVVVR